MAKECIIVSLCSTKIKKLYTVLDFTCSNRFIFKSELHSHTGCAVSRYTDPTMHYSCTIYPNKLKLYAEKTEFC